jgi:hypothetical protein
MGMSPSDGFIPNNEGVQGDLALSEFIIVPLDELSRMLEALVQEGFTDIFVQNPETNERIRAQLLHIRRLCEPRG